MLFEKAAEIVGIHIDQSGHRLQSNILCIMLFDKSLHLQQLGHLLAVQLTGQLVSEPLQHVFKLLLQCVKGRGILQLFQQRLIFRVHQPGIHAKAGKLLLQLKDGIVHMGDRLVPAVSGQKPDRFQQPGRQDRHLLLVQ
ncbi:hypothetical protein D3C73_1243420 [compost metagenome]